MGKTETNTPSLTDNPFQAGDIVFLVRMWGLKKGRAQFTGPLQVVRIRAEDVYLEATEWPDSDGSWWSWRFCRRSADHAGEQLCRHCQQAMRSC